MGYQAVCIGSGHGGSCSASILKSGFLAGSLSAESEPRIHGKNAPILMVGCTAGKHSYCARYLKRYDGPLGPVDQHCSSLRGTSTSKVGEMSKWIGSKNSERPGSRALAWRNGNAWLIYSGMVPILICWSLYPN
ncbi:hypothetical protein K469DRAFT_213851 [Zopfia rhizophila CBS 207.26]|uniref:Uncharacterized protein n=1 Tax=Zopfia rhizophila CBS 207.26 TaxID=1314779 RepID=A0A6A6DVS2_9PEZI|nr:hypothetical protein K469DRAFT_213851 [Zopfia rhizophila CBS 207.26]